LNSGANDNDDISALSETPTSYSVSCFPNPFNPSTQIRFGIARAGFVSLKIYDMLGRAVAVLVEEDKSAGYFQMSWDASRLPSGVYFLRLQASKESIIQKMMLMR